MLSHASVVPGFRAGFPHPQRCDSAYGFTHQQEPHAASAVDALVPTRPAHGHSSSSVVSSPPAQPGRYNVGAGFSGAPPRKRLTSKTPSSIAPVVASTPPPQPDNRNPGLVTARGCETVAFEALKQREAKKKGENKLKKKPATCEPPSYAKEERNADHTCKREPSPNDSNDEQPAPKAMKATKTLAQTVKAMKATNTVAQTVNAMKAMKAVAQPAKAKKMAATVRKLSPKLVAFVAKSLKKIRFDNTMFGLTNRNNITSRVYWANRNAASSSGFCEPDSKHVGRECGQKIGRLWDSAKP